MNRFANKPLYMTRGVAELPEEVQLVCISMIQKASEEVELDYLQIFDLSSTECEDGLFDVSITHRQEEPTYEHSQVVRMAKPVSEKLWFIDDESHATLLKPSEY